MTYSMENSLVSNFVEAFFDKMSSKVYTYDKSSIGKIMSSVEGNFGWDTL